MQVVKIYQLNSSKNENC